MNVSRWFRDLRFRLFYLLVTRPRPGLITLGGECQWTLSPQGLGPGSVVLSAGAGHDISFERELIKRFGCRVVLLDPSPTGIATVQRENLPSDRLTFFPVGLAGADETVTFQAPKDAAEGSFVGSSRGGDFQFACRSLSSLMTEFGWNRIDLLKIDIEGFEYAVFEELLRARLDVRQICVEFHHGPQFGRPNRDTVRMILALRKAGYDLIHRFYWDHTFLLRER